METRKQAILRAVVKEFTTSAVPVGSQALQSRYFVNLSSATIRSEPNAPVPLPVDELLASDPAVPSPAIPSPSAPSGAVVDALNALATAFDTPEYARVSLLQVRFSRSGMASLMPVFMQSAPDTRPMGRGRRARLRRAEPPWAVAL